MLRIVVLGSGATIPTPERALPSISMRYEGDVYLFDCGEGTQRQMMKCGISYAKVRAIFISHLHGDHIFGIPGLFYTLKMTGRTEPLTIFGPPGTKKRVTELVGKEAEFLQIHDVEPGWSYDVGGAKFTAFKTNHRLQSLGYVFEEEKGLRFDKEKCEKLGMKGRMFKTIQEKGEVEIKGKGQAKSTVVKLADVTYTKDGKKVVVTGDTMYCGESVNASQSADLLFHESTFAEEMREKADEDMHSTAKDAARVAKEAGVKKLLLYHIGNRYKDDKLLLEEARAVFPNTEATKDRMEILV